MSIDPVCEPGEIAVVIPARNEERRIAACLRALASACPDRMIARLYVVANNCLDRTADIARRCGARYELALDVITSELTGNQGVGAARRIGCAHAMREQPGLRWLLTTDADCLVAPDWIAANLRNLKTASSVCGTVRLMEGETHFLDGMPPDHAHLEGVYRALLLQFFHRIRPEPDNPWPHHGEAPGASLGFHAAAYGSVGGFRDLVCGEDRDIVRRLKAAGHSVRHAEDIVVHASCRLTGRAPGGMADALRSRLTQRESLVDEMLLPVDVLVARAREGSLPFWPALADESERLRLSDLPNEIEKMKQVLAGFGEAGRIPGPAAPPYPPGPQTQRLEVPHGSQHESV